MDPHGPNWAQMSISHSSVHRTSMFVHAEFINTYRNGVRLVCVHLGVYELDAAITATVGEHAYMIYVYVSIIIERIVLLKA